MEDLSSVLNKRKLYTHNVLRIFFIHIGLGDKKIIIEYLVFNYIKKRVKYKIAL